MLQPACDSWEGIANPSPATRRRAGRKASTSDLLANAQIASLGGSCDVSVDAHVRLWAIRIVRPSRPYAEPLQIEDILRCQQAAWFPQARQRS